ncbi:transcriptional regulator, TetR family [Paenibacillus algorifonticola]|uniref:Transcriptional regulator, TetR family n=1 Tax=Paenibacillus algorifonticola TaxID=684063 RepID=A0A1I1Z806_9BACL|nr:TetR/AcrR family transcriptional regulator [Paenibacillus algorifonticola]SFE27837.1 transcriptional regulator, TetR family [Paenibacillus algorifonticola]
MVLRQQRKQELKERIFMYAVQLFREKGFANVTIDEITQGCGVAKGTFYNYFPRKEAILLDLGQTQMKVTQENLERYSLINGIKEKLLTLFRDLFQKYAVNAELAKLTISEMLRSPLLMQEEFNIINKFEELLKGLLNEAQQQNQLPSYLASADVAAVLAGLYFHALLTWAASLEDALQMQAGFERRFEVIWEGLKMRGEFA